MTVPESDRTTAALFEAGHRLRSPATRIMLAACGIVMFLGFAGLGTWQLHRLQWKESLIDRIEERIHAAPVEAPKRDQWPQIDSASSEYWHVRVTGTFAHELASKVLASTRLGSGYWVLTPIRTPDGSMVMINRGFIPHDADAKELELDGRADEQVTITGLLRMSETGGGFLRDNDPANGRWYSRDVDALAAFRGLSHVAPYFVDADAASPATEGRIGLPVEGLTVVSFPNNHLLYALTWYALAVMIVIAGVFVAQDERRNLRLIGYANAGHVVRKTLSG